MKISKLRGFCCVLSLSAGLATAGVVLADDQTTTVPTTTVPTTTVQSTADLRETMPVLTGDQWQRMDQDSKLAFIWGVGHVVTIEEHVVQRHPELKREDFVAKLAEGLRGIPMNNIVQTVDNYYQANPQDRDLPVMRVVWRQMVKPKLKSGIGNAPLKDNDHQ